MLTTLLSLQCLTYSNLFNSPSLFIEVRNTISFGDRENLLLGHVRATQFLLSPHGLVGSLLNATIYTSICHLYHATHAIT